MKEADREWYDQEEEGGMHFHDEYEPFIGNQELFREFEEKLELKRKQ